jgi:3-hydroxypropanoate dehydrogenase
MSKTVNDEGLDTIFRQARSQNSWTDQPVSNTLLLAIYDLMRMGPTSANCSPARMVFLTTPEAKERIRPYLIESNVEKVTTAPVCVILGYDTKFYDKIPQLFPHNPEAREWFAGNAELAETTAFRNSTLQGAYLMIAARSVGLDCGPMSGFDNAGVDKEFFPGGSVKSNFLCGIGIGDPKGVFERSPRLDFEDACQVL